MDKPVRVLHVISAMTSGGTESFIMYQYRHMDRDKVQFDFLTSRAGEYIYNEEIRRMGGTIYLIKPPTEQGAWGFVKDIRRILKADPSIRVVHAHTFLNCGLAMLGAFLGGAKIRISHSHQARHFVHKGLKRKLYNLTMRALIKLFATDYFACGNAAGENLYGKAFYGKKGRFIPNAIEFTRFDNVKNEDKAALKREFDIPENVPVYTNIGRFMKQKNHAYIIKIAKQLMDSGHDYRMFLVGEGELLPEIKRLAEQNNLSEKLIFTGARRDIPAILGITDVFILPSLFEGLPVTVIEAQASLVPSVCSTEVTKQADAGMGLVDFVGITDEDLPKWEDAIKKSEKKNNFDRDAVYARLRELGYDNEENARRLSEVYLRAEQKSGI